MFIISFLLFIWTWHFHIGFLYLKRSFMLWNQRTVLINQFKLILGECKSYSFFRFFILLNQYLLKLFAIVRVILNLKIKLWPVFVIIMEYFIRKSFQSFHFFFFKLLLFFLISLFVHYWCCFLFFWSKYLCSVQQNIFHYSYWIIVNIHLSIFCFLNNVLFLIFDIFWLTPNLIMRFRFLNLLQLLNHSLGSCISLLLHFLMIFCKIFVHKIFSSFLKTV